MTAPDTTRQIREEIFGPLQASTNVVRLLCDEWWPSGTTVGHINGEPMLPSIIRRWPRGGHANPHIDQRLLPLLDSFELKRRIGVNVYIQTPEAGGEIEFWDRRSNEDNYVTTKRSDYSLDREGLGEPHLSLRPCQGDLIMFDAARLHGVRRVSVGSRVTSACFLGVRSTAEPLIVFA